MAEIQHELKIRAPRAKIFWALTDRMALEHWHRTKVSGDQREWRMEYPDGTVFRWKVVTSGPGRFAWQCVEGPGQAAGKEATFTLSEPYNGHTLAEFLHAGWPETRGNRTSIPGKKPHLHCYRSVDRERDGRAVDGRAVEVNERFFRTRRA
jgi:uncharacterized protein YndB with AHSA1/START domain